MIKRKLVCIPLFVALLLVPCVKSVVVYENKTNEFQVTNSTKIIIDVCGVNETNPNEYFDIVFSYNECEWNEPPTYSKGNVTIKVAPLDTFYLNIVPVQGICSVEVIYEGDIPNDILKQSVLFYSPSLTYPLKTESEENYKKTWIEGEFNSIISVAGYKFEVESYDIFEELIKEQNKTIKQLKEIISNQNSTINSLRNTINNFNCPECSCPACPNIECPNLECPECRDYTKEDCMNVYGLFDEIPPCPECEEKSCLGFIITLIIFASLCGFNIFKNVLKSIKKVKKVEKNEEENPFDWNN